MQNSHNFPQRHPGSRFITTACGYRNSRQVAPQPSGERPAHPTPNNAPARGATLSPETACVLAGFKLARALNCARAFHSSFRTNPSGSLKPGALFVAVQRAGQRAFHARLSDFLIMGGLSILSRAT